jgi:hypothetical protein
MDFHAISWDFMPTVALLSGNGVERTGLFYLCSSRFGRDNPVDKFVSGRIMRDSSGIMGALAA